MKDFIKHFLIYSLYMSFTVIVNYMGEDYIGRPRPSLYHWIIAISIALFFSIVRSIILRDKK